MKYTGMPMGMWLLFSGSFRKQLEEVLGYSREEACKITVNAKRQYRKLIGKLPEFERKDRFKMNIVNCAMLSAFLLNMPERPSVPQATEYYKKSMMTKPMKWFCRKSGKKKFTEGLIPAMCRLDYTVSEAGGASDFVREYTIALGGPYCDCGYRKR